MKNKATMLEYCKQILKAVHFDQQLFKKEYRKSLKWLQRPDVSELKSWIRNEFKSTQPTN